MIANVAGRNMTVDAKMRRYNSSRQYPFLSQDYLKKGKKNKVENCPNSPALGIGFFGENAGRIVDGSYVGGTQKYTYKPLKQEDWTMTEEPAITKRTLNGFISRSFIIP